MSIFFRPPMGMARRGLSALAKALVQELARLVGEPRVIKDREGKEPYLSRWYLVGAPKTGGEAFDDAGNPKPDVEWKKELFGVYIHRFHASDQGDALHNHPWKWALSIVLSGGYSEELRSPKSSRPGHLPRSEWRYVPRRRDVLPLSLNFITQHTFHRVDLFEDDAWSIFIVGPRVASWSFWDRRTGEVTDWRAWLEKARAG